MNETVKWLYIAAHLNAEISHPGGASVAVRYKLPLPSPLLLSVAYHFCEPDVKLD